MEGDPVDVYVFDSESVNLTCENSAEPPASMKWAFDGSRFIHSDDNYLVSCAFVRDRSVTFNRSFSSETAYFLG